MTDKRYWICRYCGNANLYRHLTINGYGCGKCGAVSEEMVKKPHLVSEVQPLHRPSRSHLGRDILKDA